MPSYLEGLNPQQRQAVETVHGRVLILAGAGSGKTRVLTLRMVHLLNQWKVPPSSILGLTFTNKAAEEMRHRIASMVDASQAKKVVLATFHSFCMQVLRSEITHLGYTPDFTLYNEYDVKRLVTLIAKDLLGHEGQLPSLAPTLAVIAQAKNLGLDSQQLQGELWHDQFCRDVYRRLCDSMRAYNAVDFDHLLALTVELFEKFPAVLEKYQARFSYLMIDEYQDTNPIQYRLAELLSRKQGNLCVVGDDDQSIYGWRGAEVRNILEFPADASIKLEQNYRSTNNILKAANAVIAHNQNRYKKVLWSVKGDGPLIEVFHAPTDVDEAQAVVCRMVNLKVKWGLQWKDMAILYRSNALSRQFEMALLKHTWQDGEQWVRGIPYQVFGGTEFYERREVQDLFAYLRVIVNGRDEEALLRIINQPRRGIGESSLDALTAYNRKEALPLWTVLKGLLSGDLPDDIKEKVSAKAFDGIRDFIQTIEDAKERFANDSLQGGMRWLVERIAYDKAIEEEVKSQQMRDFKWENVQELISAMAEFEQGDKVSLRDFISTFPLQADWQKARKGMTQDCVHLMTFHSAKGLEFKACFLVGMEDHIIPHEKSMQQTGIEEERRLMYVAITRAMQFLTISMARQRKRMGKDHPSRPSCFLFDIPKELLNNVRWDAV